MITNKICIQYSAFNSSDPSWLLIFLFTHFLLHILAGIRRGGREGEGGGGWGRVWDKNKDIKWETEQIMERLPSFLAIVWFAQHPQPMAASMTSINRCRRKMGEEGGMIIYDLNREEPKKPNIKRHPWNKCIFQVYLSHPENRRGTDL